MAKAPRPPRDLAFIDLETTGLGPTKHRIAEIGVVTLDSDGRVDEWGTLVNPGQLGRGQRLVEGVDDAQLAGAPRFAEIAADLARRLQGRLLVAHNARFDYAFLKAEFLRAGLAFEAPALCTVMLSRKLYPGHALHHLDALIERHGLEAGTRHRALPDALVLHRFWQVVRKEVPARLLKATIAKLLAEPLLPPHLDLGLVEALPEKPGVYVMRGRNGRALRVARASNLRREARAYFQLDRISGRAAKISYEVCNIEWRACEGEIAARLAEIELMHKESPARARRSEHCSVRVDPAAASQLAEIVPAAEVTARAQDFFGLYPTGRKAKNALLRMAVRRRLCNRSLGLEVSACTLCNAEEGACASMRTQNLVRVLTALSATRLQPWPYAGPVGLREGRTVHVFDQWQHLGSAKTAPEIAELALLRPSGFDAQVFDVLTKALPRLGPRRLKTFRRPGAATQ
jgi:DNA polymerase-3 subunit epsilon